MAVTSGSESTSSPLSADIMTLFEIEVPVKVLSIVNSISITSQFPGVILPVLFVTGPVLGPTQPLLSFVLKVIPAGMISVTPILPESTFP